MNERLFLVQVNQKSYLFTKEKFLNFCSNIKGNRDWSFSVGYLNTNECFTSSKNMSEEEFLEIFNVEEIPQLLLYKETRFGNHFISDMPFFIHKIHRKYGRKIDWNDPYYTEKK